MGSLQVACHPKLLGEALDDLKTNRGGEIFLHSARVQSQGPALENSVSKGNTLEAQLQASCSVCIGCPGAFHLAAKQFLRSFDERKRPEP